MPEKRREPASTQERYARIWRVVAAIPPGKVASYGQVAELAGIARGARQVGRALGAAPPELNLPWHRVLNAAGRIALPAGSRGYKKQRERLVTEGVVMRGDRVDLTRCRWTPGLDEILFRM